MIFKSFVKVQMKTTPTKEGEKKEREKKKGTVHEQSSIFI